MPRFEYDEVVDEYRLAPRVPRDRSLTFGQMLAVVTVIGAVIYTAGFLVCEWVKAMK